jgi:signal transduction histidine kinase/DNA-binding response OmpR family regulator
MRKIFFCATLKQKLTTIILLVCSIVLLLSSLAYFGLENYSFRHSMVANQTSLAGVIAANAAVALPFNDRELARNTLKSLTFEPNIQLAYIFDRFNEPLAQYIRKDPSSRSSGIGHPLISPAEYKQLAEGIQAGEKAFSFTGDHLAVFCPVVTQGQRVGMVYLNTDLKAFARWKRLFAGSVIAVLGLSFLLAYLLSRQLQHLISRPILYLVDKMQVVANDEDFTIRATKRSNDEIGALIDGFNDMLEHLQNRDQQLANYRLHLEDLVGKRTAELRSSNDELQEAIAELEQARDTAEEANRIKSRFLANISHELRTPMVGVLSSTELLLSSGLEADQLSLVETLNSSGEALLEILNDLLDLSKIEAGKLTLEHVEFNLLEVIDCPIELLGKVAFGKGVELICHVAPEISPVLHGDPGRLRQVLFNLLSNAIKFTHAGEVCLRVVPEKQLSEKMTLRFEIIDTGIGIEPADQQRIFESFSQADNSTTRLHGGTGLGLSIVKQLVGIMGGHVSLESRPGHGSVFSFAVSFDRGSVVPDPPEDGAGKRILVIEKNLSACHMLHQHLQYAGWSVHVSHKCSFAGKKLEASLLHNEPFDVVLLSDAFPLEDRCLLMEKLRRSSAFQKIRLIVMGPRNSHAAWEQGTRNAISAYFCKPLLPSWLHGSLANVLNSPANQTYVPTQLAAVVEESDSSAEKSTRSSGSILVAEDNLTTGKLIDISLSNIGYQVTVVTDGREAVNLVGQRAFDLLLMDCQMPAMDGYTAARNIRAAGHQIPIVALTASSRQEDAERCREAGMNDFVCKPFKHKFLHQVIARWLREGQNPSAEVL